MERHLDTKQYKYSKDSQTIRIHQAIKDYTYGRITQQQLGLTIMECGKKLTMLQPQDPPLFGLS